MEERWWAEYLEGRGMKPKQLLQALEEGNPLPEAREHWGFYDIVQRRKYDPLIDFVFSNLPVSLVNNRQFLMDIIYYANIRSISAWMKHPKITEKMKVNIVNAVNLHSWDSLNIIDSVFVSDETNRKYLTHTRSVSEYIPLDPKDPYELLKCPNCSATLETVLTMRVKTPVKVTDGMLRTERDGDISLSFASIEPVADIIHIKPEDSKIEHLTVKCPECGYHGTLYDGSKITVDKKEGAYETVLSH